MAKRLIYTDSYKEKASWVYPDGGGEEIVNSSFTGQDVRTGESISHNHKYESPWHFYDSFFEENDVLYFQYEPDKLIMKKYKDDDKLSFEEIKEEYKQLKEAGNSEDEINNIMMNKYSINSKTDIKPKTR